MKVKSIKYNLVMSILRMATGMLFPIIIMPYINRILNSDSIGKVEYASTVINYFILFTSLGIPIYGVREIAKYRDSEKMRSKIFVELSLILLISNMIAYLVFFLFLKFSNTMNLERNVFYILSLNIVFTTLGFEWFYQGIEDQKYITIRSIVVRLISIISIFLFVKTEQDYLKYAFILVAGVVGGNIFNVINLRKYIKIMDIKLKELAPFSHLKNILIMFFATVAISIYTQMDIIMIGNQIGMSYVALYNMPMKFLRLISSVITVLGATLLPRITNMYFSDRIEEYKNYLEKIMKALMIYTIFAAILLFNLSVEIINIFGGKNFIGSEITMKWLSIVIIVSGLSYYLGVIVLYSQKKDSNFLYGVISASIVNFTLNKLLIPRYYQNGAAIATLLAEITVVFVITLTSKKYLFGLKIFNKNNFKILLSGIFTTVLIEKFYSLIEIREALILNFVIKSFMVFLGYMIFLILLKEKFIHELLEKIKLKLKGLKR